MLRQVLGQGAEIGCYRSRGLNIVIDDGLHADNETAPETFYGLKNFATLDEALSDGPDVVFVTNPISMHVETGLAAARAGCNVFFEKPLGDTLAGLDELEDALAANGLVALVGYQFRFHPALAAIRGELEAGSIGRVISAQLQFGEWLPGMHPYEDYRESHAARADQGGGVILCLSHEIDYACWLFGLPRRVFCVGGHLSNLAMSGVEDTAHLLLECEVDGRAVPISIYLDFVQRPQRRECLIIGETGHIRWDHAENVVRVSNSTDGQSKEIAFTGFRRNDMFEAQCRNLVAAIEGSAAPVCSLSDGKATLQVCLAAKQSMTQGQAVSVGATQHAAA